MLSFQEKESGNGRASTVSMGSGAPPAGELPDYLAKEVVKITVRSAVELEAVWTQVRAFGAGQKCFYTCSSIYTSRIISYDSSSAASAKRQAAAGCS